MSISQHPSDFNLNVEHDGVVLVEGAGKIAGKQAAFCGHLTIPQVEKVQIDMALIVKN